MEFLRELIRISIDKIAKYRINAEKRKNGTRGGENEIPFWNICNANLQR